MCDYINYKRIKLANQQRIDIFIRILFIEWYYKKNDYGDKLYTQMRKIHKVDPQMWKERFIELIKSVEENGFDETKPLPMTNDYRLYNDGAHRLACIIYFNIINIPIIMNHKNIRYCGWYGTKWLKQNFNKTYRNLILDRYNDWIEVL